MRGSVLALAGLVSVAAIASAQAGNECYRRVVEPPQYQTIEENVLLSPEREIPEYVPAVTRRVAETVVVEPERAFERVIPPVYGVQEETVLVRPASRQWVLKRHYGETIGCWVDTPAEYATRQRTVLLQPEHVVTDVVPAVTATRYRTEVVEPAGTVYRHLPARYGVRTHVEEVAPASAHWAPASDVCGHAAY